MLITIINNILETERKKEIDMVDGDEILKMKCDTC